MVKERKKKTLNVMPTLEYNVLVWIFLFLTYFYVTNILALMRYYCEFIFSSLEERKDENLER
jgi:hypothetical protein